MEIDKLNKGRELQDEIKYVEQYKDISKDFSYLHICGGEYHTSLKSYNLLALIPLKYHHRFYALLDEIATELKKELEEL